MNLPNILPTITLNEHPFATFIRTLGKGKNGARHLTLDEANAAMLMILNNEVTDIQLGAFLMLLRYQEETAEELAGFAKATHQYSTIPDIKIDIDWPTYAGKRRHYPWYLLAIKLLVTQGIKILMHGAGQHASERLFSEQFLPALAIKECQNWQEVAVCINEQHLAFIGLHRWQPKLQRMIDLRSLLGVRSPIHSLVRLLNPLRAHCSLQSVFHPNYQVIHQQASQLLGDNSIIIKGEGGETEVRPDNSCILLGTDQGQIWEEIWPTMTDQRLLKPPVLKPDYLLAVWQKKVKDEYADLAIPATIALALRGLGVTRREAFNEATKLWESHSL